MHSSYPSRHSQTRGERHKPQSLPRDPAGAGPPASLFSLRLYSLPLHTSRTRSTREGTGRVAGTGVRKASVSDADGRRLPCVSRSHLREARPKHVRPMYFPFSVLSHTSSGKSYLATCRFRISANDWTVLPTEPNGVLDVCTSVPEAWSFRPRPRG